jgi:DNA-directed RNA polymerase subunit RPC12/RpoP
MEWDVRIGGAYRCVNCGEEMVELVLTDADGRIVLKEEPLGCPWCDDAFTVYLRLSRALPKNVW